MMTCARGRDRAGRFPWRHPCCGEGVSDWRRPSLRPVPRSQVRAPSLSGGARLRPRTQTHIRLPRAGVTPAWHTLTESFSRAPSPSSVQVLSSAQSEKLYISVQGEQIPCMCELAFTSVCVCGMVCVCMQCVDM